jgi:hypothetical protein
MSENTMVSVKLRFSYASTVYIKLKYSSANIAIRYGVRASTVNISMRYS